MSEDELMAKYGLSAEKLASVLKQVTEARLKADARKRGDESEINGPVKPGFECPDCGFIDSR
ncbi:MAG: hypothetical protein ACK2TX_10080, partial [Anaerolineales bacterium]